MATPRNLTRPPIVEALVDFRAQLNAEPAALTEFIRRELGTEFPNSEVRNSLEAKLEIRDGLVVPPSMEDQGFHGIWSSNGDASKVVQFRKNGFTLNYLREYHGGEDLLGEALSLWSRYTQACGATPVERVALRYINKLSLPYKRGEDFDVYLTAAATMPPGTPQLVLEFLTRVVASVEAEDTSRNQLVVTQRLLGENGNPVLLLDIDVFRQGTYNEQQLLPVLQSLRILKSETFFAMLTDAAVDLYASLWLLPPRSTLLECTPPGPIALSALMASRSDGCFAKLVTDQQTGHGRSWHACSRRSARLRIETEHACLPSW